MKVNIDRITIEVVTRDLVGLDGIKGPVRVGYEVEVEYNINNKLNGAEQLMLRSERERGFDTIGTLEDRLKDIILDALCDNPESVNVVMP